MNIALLQSETGRGMREGGGGGGLIRYTEQYVLKSMFCSLNK